MMLSLNNLGFSLHPVETRDGTDVFRLETGFKLADEFPFDIFVEETKSRFHIFDEGLTIHSMLVLSFSLLKNNRRKSIASTVGERGVMLTPSGSFEMYGPKEKAAELVVNYISAMLDLDRWVIKTLSYTPTKTNLIESAKVLFQKWKPQSVIVSNPKVEGFGGTQLEFDFSVDGDFIDILSPVANSASNFMYKSAVFRMAENEGRTLGLLDDRENREAARTEATILSTSCPVLLFSALERNAFSVCQI